MMLAVEPSTKVLGVIQLVQLRTREEIPFHWCTAQRKHEGERQWKTELQPAAPPPRMTHAHPHAHGHARIRSGGMVRGGASPAVLAKRGVGAFTRSSGNTTVQPQRRVVRVGHVGLVFRRPGAVRCWRLAADPVLAKVRLGRRRQLRAGSKRKMPTDRISIASHALPRVYTHSHPWRAHHLTPELFIPAQLVLNAVTKAE